MLLGLGLFGQEVEDKFVGLRGDAIELFDIIDFQVFLFGFPEEECSFFPGKHQLPVLVVFLVLVQL